MRILWACTGSVATVKVPEAVLELLSQGHHVKVVTTKHGLIMLHGGPAQKYNPTAYADFLKAQVQVVTDEDEWPKNYQVGKDPVLHIELRKWADVLVIAPLSANSLAKLAYGFCDNLLTCVVRAWDINRPIVIAPAMNTLMWENPHTAKHLSMLPAYFIFVPPIEKTLACNDTGVGAMAAVADICSKVTSLKPSAL